MTMKAYTLLLILCAIVSVVSSAEQLTMQQAVATALERNHTLRGAAFDRDAADWGTRNAISNYLPKIEISTSLTRIDPESERRANAAVDFIKGAAGSLGIPPSMLSEIRPFAYRDEYNTGVTVQQPIYNGGAEILRIEGANVVDDRSAYSAEDTEQDVIARVKASYYTVLKAQALVALAKESAERTQRWLDLTKRREELGSRTNTDVLRWEVQLAEDRGGIINTENALALARLQLNEVMGVDLSAEYALVDIDTTDAVGITSAVVASPQLALVGQAGSLDLGDDDGFIAAHPSMKVMQANLRLSELAIDKSWVNFKPRINLFFQYGWERNGTFALDGFRPWALALSVSFPIFNGFGDYTGLQMAKAEYNKASEQAESFRRGLLLQATNARLTVKATRQRIDIARAGLQHARSVLGSVSRRYDAGAASNVDMIDAQTAYTSAKTNYITAQYDYYISEVQLARTTGTISRQ
jgi:outer membrane protein